MTRTLCANCRLFVALKNERGECGGCDRYRRQSGYTRPFAYAQAQDRHEAEQIARAKARARSYQRHTQEVTP